MKGIKSVPRLLLLVIVVVVILLCLNHPRTSLMKADDNNVLRVTRSFPLNTKLQ